MMVEIAGALYLFATASFAVISIVVGMRLVSLSRRTGQWPERLLGIGVMSTAGFGYGVMMVGVLGNRALLAKGESSLFFLGVTLAGWLFHNVGVLFMLRFVVSVFRPGVVWARALEVMMATVLWGGWLVYMLTGGLGSLAPTAGYWVAFSAIGTYPLWIAAESFAYYHTMRRRAAIGLADPLVCNRFLLWGLAALCTAASIWLVNVPFWSGVDLHSVEGEAVTAASMLGTAAFGIGTVLMYWLTFFPPASYRARFARLDKSDETIG